MIHRAYTASGHSLFVIRAHGVDWCVEYSGEYPNNVPKQADLDEYLKTLTPVPYLGPPVFDENDIEQRP